MRLFEGTPFDRPPRCEQCNELEEECICPPKPPPLIAPEKQTAKLQLEKRKRGKQVTVIRGLTAEGNNLPELLTRLKTACGAGGTIQQDSIEIQGNQIEQVRKILVEIGFRVSG